MGNSRTFEVETSLTLDYRKERWGLERIVLDTVSNHLPADCGGRHTYVRLKQQGKWVDLKEANPTLPTEEVMFGDDGKGYTTTKLGTLRSTKADNPFSVGQFGEGLKLVAATALRNALEMMYRSRNWWAVPFKKPEVDDGEHYDRLCFRVTENGDTLDGSRTVFFNPPSALLDEVFKLPEKVLAFNDNYTELHNGEDNYDPNNPFATYLKKLYQTVDADIIPKIISTLEIPDYYKISFGGDSNKIIRSLSGKPALANNPLHYYSRIIDLDGSRKGKESKKSIFVKGVWMEDSHSLFSYDLGTEDIAPDRHYADHQKVLDEMERLLKGCTNEEVITAVLRAAEDDSKHYEEFAALNSHRKTAGFKHGGSLSNIFEKNYSEESLFSKFKQPFPELHPWVVAFKKLYGKNAVIASNDTNINKDAQLLGFSPVKLNQSVEGYLSQLGIDNADKVATAVKEYQWIDISALTPEERAVYQLIPALNQAAFGDEAAIPIDTVRIYEGVFFPSGREAESNMGVTIIEKDGSKIVGIKRSLLKNPNDFATFYFHEAGHVLTGKEDYSREHTDFGYAGMARLALEKIAKKS